MRKESYEPGEFRRCCILRGIAGARIVDKYIARAKKIVYHEEDFISVHRMDEAVRDGVAHSNPLSPARMARADEKAKRLG